MLKFLAAMSIFFASVAHAAPADDLDALFDDYWANEMSENPFVATFSGVSGYDDKAPGVTPEDYARRREEAEAFLAQLQAVDRSEVDENHALSAALLEFILEHEITLAAFDQWRIPFLADTGFHTDFGYVVGATSFRTEADYENYIARLKALPRYIDQNIENMREGLRDGFTQPKEILPLIMPSFEAQVKDNAAAHPYYAPFKSMPNAISSRRQAALRQQGKTVLEGDVIPAFARLAEFMREEYMPGARDPLGAYVLPRRRASHRRPLRYYTTLDTVTPESIHSLGLREVARIRKEMSVVIAKTGFKGTFMEFIEFLRTDKQFYPKTPEALLERAAWIAKDIDGRLPAPALFSRAGSGGDRAELYDRALYQRAGGRDPRRAILGEYLCARQAALLRNDSADLA